MPDPDVIMAELLARRRRRVLGKRLSMELFVAF
jgi:hypothetical protein